MRACTKKARGRTNTEIFFYAWTLRYSFHSCTQAIYMLQNWHRASKRALLSSHWPADFALGKEVQNTSKANGLSHITPHDSLITMKESNLIDMCWITALVHVQTSIVSREERLHYVALISYFIFFLDPFQCFVFCLHAVLLACYWNEESTNTLEIPNEFSFK